MNDTLAIDAGSLGYALDLEEQKRVHRVIVTHSHVDHIATLPIFVSEVFPFLEQAIVVHSIPEVIGALRDHIFNGLVWPAFDAIELPDGRGAALRYDALEPLVPVEIEGLRVTPVEMNHTVRTIGLALEDERSAIIVTSDTHHTEEIWRLAGRLERLKAVFVDVSYPDEMETLAAASRHFTPRSLDLELRKMRRSVPVLAVHLKPQFHARVREQLARLGRPDVGIARIGHEYVF